MLSAQTIALASERLPIVPCWLIAGWSRWGGITGWVLVKVVGAAICICLPVIVISRIMISNIAWLINRVDKISISISGARTRTQHFWEYFSREQKTKISGHEAQHKCDNTEYVLRCVFPRVCGNMHNYVRWGTGRWDRPSRGSSRWRIRSRRWRSCTACRSEQPTTELSVARWTWLR